MSYAPNPCDGIEVGQIWERNSDGVRVEIAAVLPEFEDLRYRRVGIGRTAAIFANNFRGRYTLTRKATS